MEITNEEMRFVTKRRRFVKAWPLVGTILISLAIGLGVWLFLSKPLLANPFTVLSKLKSGSIPHSTLVLMAGILPIVVLMCIALVITIVLFVFASFNNERKYLAMVQRIIDQKNIPHQSESVQVSVAQQGDSRNSDKQHS